MICENPRIIGKNICNCGQCMPCRINKQRKWEHRINLENTHHKFTTWATFTYADEHLPKLASGTPTLRKSALQKLQKRIRKAFLPLKLRFASAGEYGPDHDRPHFHMIIFGLPPCTGTIRISGPNNQRLCPCDTCTKLRKCWKLGHIHVEPFRTANATYITKDILKGMTRKNAPELMGREPEFLLTSRRPGLGYKTTIDIAKTLKKYDLQKKYADVPGQLRHGRTLMPLDRYMKGKIRIALGRDPNTPEAAKNLLDLDTIKAIAEARQLTTAPGMARHWREILKGILRERARPAAARLRAKLLIKRATRQQRT